ncbi:CaiB/BaiF CoA-transferase family protein [Bradyrhizobium sp. CCBAU 11386]|uniref:CaiB/BaiF CoA-transferase family protein n=1 Tax=Bradyrhizobium sp. CCBAU 11386 TaxID=1630837 RepID=UPI002304307E|nr:CoA transferase [Bradyrhizobium sp. CCBAU 11386]
MDRKDKQPPGVLSHLRGIEIATSDASSYCARLFVDFGADVQNIEPPRGDRIRRTAPLTVKGQSAWFAFLNFNKSSTIIDPAEAGTITRLTALIEDCDVLIDGRDVDSANCPPVDVAAIRERHSGLIHIEASWFGRGGPYADFAAADSTIRALAGLIKLVGPAEGPPSHAPDFQTGNLAGLWGFIAAASSVIARMRGEQGRRWSLSIFESSLALSEYLIFEASVHGDVVRRLGINRFWPVFPAGIYETKKGWLGVRGFTPAQWRAFCDMLDLSELGDNPDLLLGKERLQHIEQIEQQFAPRLKTRTAQQWFTEGRKRKIPIVPVPQMSDLLHDAEMKERGAIVPVLLDEEEGLTAGSMQRLSLTPPRRGGKVPVPGEQQAITNVRRRLPSPSAACVDAGRPPMDGVRVIDFSMGWSGPLCTRILADLGADVIKIEAIRRPGITLDLTRPRGLALLKRLLAKADIVVDNYSVDVLPKLGPGCDALRALNPQRVKLSMSTFGADSIYRDCRSYGPTLEQGSGLPGIVGKSDFPPVMSNVAFGEAIGGLNGCVAVLIALICARDAGQGQLTDLAQIECMLPFAAPWLTIHSIDPMPPKRYGNRHPQFVPHGCFRCAGEDNWLVVAATDNEMWQRLASLIGRPDWAIDASLNSAEARRSIDDNVENAIEAWTRSRDADEAMFELQSVRVAPAVVRHPIDLLQDPHLRSCAFLQQLERPFIGAHLQPSVPIREGGGPYTIRTAAPTLGQHNSEILTWLLKLSDSDVAELASEGIIGMTMLREKHKAKSASSGPRCVRKRLLCAMIAARSRVLSETRDGTTGRLTWAARKVSATCSHPACADLSPCRGASSEQPWGALKYTARRACHYDRSIRSKPRYHRAVWRASTRSC